MPGCLLYGCSLLNFALLPGWNQWSRHSSTPLQELEQDWILLVADRPSRNLDPPWFASGSGIEVDHRGTEICSSPVRSGQDLRRRSTSAPRRRRRLIPFRHFLLRFWVEIGIRFCRPDWHEHPPLKFVGLVSCFGTKCGSNLGTNLKIKFILAKESEYRASEHSE